MKNSHNQKQHAFMSLLRVRSAVMMLAVLCALVTSVPAFAQTTIRGKVTNESGAPIDGVTVSIKGTANGTTTDSKGEFTIVAAPGTVLVFSYVGYGQKEVRVTDNTTVNISLNPTDRDLGEVVVIGYGTQRKKDVTGSTVTVKGETLNEIKASNIFNQL